MVLLDVTALSYEELLLTLKEFSLGLEAVKRVGESIIIECQTGIVSNG